MNTALRHALDRVGISQSELARRLGIHTSHVNRWTKRRLRPTHDQLIRAMKELEIEDPIAMGYRIESEPKVVDA